MSVLQTKGLVRRNDSIHRAAIVLVMLGGLTACATPRQLALQQHPANVKTLMAFGNMAFDDSRWAIARKYYRLAHKENPEYCPAVVQFALAGLEDGKHLEQARRMIEQILPAANPRDTAILLNTLVRITIRERRWADAQVALDQSQNQAQSPGLDPDFPSLLQDSQDSLARAP